MSSNPLRGVRTLIKRNYPLYSSLRPLEGGIIGGIFIRNYHASLSDRASINRLLRPHAAEDYSNGPSSQNYELIDGHYYVTSDFFNLLIARFLHNLDQEANYMEEEVEEGECSYWSIIKQRTHNCVDKIDDEDICSICQAEFEHEEIIGTL
ncbi:hypothetical protein HAX54_005308 [Datura stramonium]|uniref:RING/U-box superfamily protein n=1 Tax=Datura stramonium TaxID=4076 RepID=A0ABS8RUV5_DATST|nr:hypothetical protein [Datura stramonium]